MYPMYVFLAIISDIRNLRPRNNPSTRERKGHSFKKILLTHHNGRILHQRNKERDSVEITTTERLMCFVGIGIGVGVGIIGLLHK